MSYNRYEIERSGKKYVQWTKKNVLKKDINKYMSKLLLKFSVQGNVELDLSSGAIGELRKRVDDIEGNTMRLIVMSGQKRLFKLFKRRMTSALIKDYIDGGGSLDELIDLKANADSSPEEIARSNFIEAYLVQNPDMIKPQDSFMATQLLENNVFQPETILGNKALSERALHRDETALEFRLEILDKYPTLVPGMVNRYHSPVSQALAEGKLKLVLNPNYVEKSETEDDES